MSSSLPSEKTLSNLIYNFYKRYYCDSLGLPQWRDLIDKRYHEDSITGKRLFYYFNKFKISLPSDIKNILVVGCGTGAELFYLSSLFPSASIKGIDPDQSAIDIIKLKQCIDHQVDIEAIVGYAEKLPFLNSSFDLVICYTVLEHVNSVSSTLSEIARVLNNSGLCFLALPDYRWPEEPHYKLAVPPPAYFPEIIPFFLSIKRRPVGFFSSLNLLTPRSIQRHFNALDIPFTRYREYSFTVAKNPFLWVYSALFGVDRNQFYTFSGKR